MMSQMRSKVVVGVVVWVCLFALQCATVAAFTHYGITTRGPDTVLWSIDASTGAPTFVAEHAGGVSAGGGSACVAGDTVYATVVDYTNASTPLSLISYQLGSNASTFTIVVQDLSVVYTGMCHGAQAPWLICRVASKIPYVATYSEQVYEVYANGSSEVVWANDYLDVSATTSVNHPFPGSVLTVTTSGTVQLLNVVAESTTQIGAVTTDMPRITAVAYDVASGYVFGLVPIAQNIVLAKSTISGGWSVVGMMEGITLRTVGSPCGTTSPILVTNGDGTLTFLGNGSFDETMLFTVDLSNANITNKVPAQFTPTMLFTV